MFTLEAGRLPVPSHRKTLQLGGVPLEKNHKSGSFSWVQTHDGAHRTTLDRAEATERTERAKGGVSPSSIYLYFSTHHSSYLASSLERAGLHRLADMQQMEGGKGIWETQNECL